VGIFSKLFGSSGGGSSEERFVKKQVTRLLNKYGQKELREDAMHALYQRGTPEANGGLLQRFTINHPESIVDEKDKNKIIDLLDALGAEKSTGPLEEYLANPKQSEVSMALIAYERLQGVDKTIDQVMALLEEADPDDPWSNDRKMQLISHLNNYKETEKIKETITLLIKFLEDIDDDVIFRSVELLEDLGDTETIRQPMVDLILKEEASARIRSRVLEIARDRKWYLGDIRKELEPVLPEGFFFDRRDNLKKRENKY
jgi:hypothetical protein